MSDDDGPALLVPIHVEALVVGTPDLQTPEVDLRRSYAPRTVLGEDLDPHPRFATVTGLNRPGVHVHWALPDGLTHGRVPEGAQNGARSEGVSSTRPELEFPPIPNRWLAVRLWTQDGDRSGVHSRAWVLESDRVSDDPKARSWPGAHLDDPRPEHPEDCVRRVGVQTELRGADGWRETDAERVPPLTALGDGDPAFGACYPLCRGLLGFHDDDLGDVPAATLAYLVVGWYSMPTLDPLYRVFDWVPGAPPARVLETLRDCLQQRRWTYTGLDQSLEQLDGLQRDVRARSDAIALANNAATAPAEVLAPIKQHILELDARIEGARDALAMAAPALPRRTVCHGLVWRVRWEGKDKAYGSGVPSADDTRIGVGETAAEAFAALCPTRPGAMRARDLEAFQHDLLRHAGQPGGDAVIAQKLHDRAFRPRARGVRWTVIPHASGPAAGEPRLPHVPGEVRATLAALNARQARRDALARLRDAAKHRLYEAWYRGTRAVQQADPSRQGAERATTGRTIRRLQRVIARLTARHDAVALDEPLAALREQVGTFLPGHDVVHVEDDRFWRPNDPAVVLAGRAFGRSPRHGGDGRFREDGQLLCRRSGEEVRTLQIETPRPEPGSMRWWGAITLGRIMVPRSFAAGPLSGLPRDVWPLLDEALLFTLDPRDLLGPPSFDELHLRERQWVKAYLDARWDAAARTDSEASAVTQPSRVARVELSGVFPSPVMDSRWRSNPWLPLFLHWEAGWTPATDDRAFDGPASPSNGTSFDPPERPRDATPRIYRGATLLAHSPGEALAERLRGHPAAPDGPAAKERIARFAALDTVAATLDGLTDRLLLRHGRMEIAPLDLPADAAGPPTRSVIAADVADIEWVAPEQPSGDGLLPLRAGALALRRLWVIDAFGRVLMLEADGIDGRTASAASLPSPARMPRRPEGGGGAAWFEPRLAQAARLVMQWRPADAAAANGRAADDPVCGWVVFNALYRGLTIYDARGRALGALQGVLDRPDQTSGGPTEPKPGFRWIGVPGGDGPYFEDPAASPTAEPLGAGVHPHLREFVNRLHAQHRDDEILWDRLMDHMTEVASRRPGGRQDGPLVLLVGRPLALVRATLQLELDGPPVTAEGRDRGSIRSLSFPVQIGDRRRVGRASSDDADDDADDEADDDGTGDPADGAGLVGDDGVVGYFVDGNYAELHRAGNFEQEYRSSYFAEGPAPRLSLDRPLELTLLMEPAAGVVVSSDILPRAHFHLPLGDVDGALEHREVVFFTGPVLSTIDRIRLPEPSDAYGEWSWTHHVPMVKNWSQETIVDTQNETGQFRPQGLQLVDGWLKLVTAPLDIRDLGVLGGRRPAADLARTLAAHADAPADGAPAAPGVDDERTPPLFEIDGDQAVLTWMIVGADELTLEPLAPDGTPSGPPLFRSRLHPLPRQFRVRVDAAASFRLTATADRIPRIGDDRPDPSASGPQTRRRAITLVRAGAH